MPIQTTSSGAARFTPPVSVHRPRALLATFAALSFVLSVSPLPLKAQESIPAKTLAELREAAKSGEPQPLLDLADELAYGESATAATQAESTIWYRRAAEKGQAEGQHHLALILWTGDGVEKNQVEAVQWFRRAADQGKASSQYWLAGAYEFGEGGLPADPAEAARWYRRAADQGYASAQANLGQLYAAGSGVAQNDAEAVRWLKMAAEQNNASGEHGLAEMYAVGRGVAKDDREAVGLFERAANKDFPASMIPLGEAYEQGRGTAKNPVCAYFWYGFAAERGHPAGEEMRDALAAKLSPADRVEGDRLVAGTEVTNGEVRHPACPGETMTVDLTQAALGDFLHSLELVTGLKIVGLDPKAADLKFTLKENDIPWETALTRVLDGQELGWLREGVAIRIVPKPKKR